MSDSSSDALAALGVSSVLKGYLDALAQWFGPFTGNARKRFKRIIAKCSDTVDAGDDHDRLRVAINRAMEAVEPLLPRLVPFFDQYPQSSGPYRMALVGSTVTMGLTDQRIVNVAFNEAKNFVVPDPLYDFTETSASPALICRVIAQDIERRAGPYEELQAHPSHQADARVVVSVIEAVSYLGTAAEEESSAHVVMALERASVATTGGKEALLDIAMSTLEEMLSGEFHLSSATRQSELDEWNDAGFSEEEAKTWLDADIQLWDAKIFRSGAVDLETAKSWWRFTGTNAVEWMHIGILDPEAAWQYRMADISSSEAAQWIGLGILDPNTAKHYKIANMSPDEARDKAGLISTLMQEWKMVGHDSGEIMAWVIHSVGVSEAESWFEIEPNFYLAEKWINAGFSPDDAQAWKSVGLGPAAHGWSKRAFSPAQASSWIQAGVTAPDMAQEWAQSGFCPEQTKRWIDAGYSQYSIATGDVRPQFGRRRVNPDKPRRRS
jgi:hypothetical protein